MTYLRKSLIRILALTLSFGFLSAFAQNGECKGKAEGSTPAEGRDWKTYPAIVQLPAPETLYIMGDVHGDCDKLLELLKGSKLITSGSSSASTSGSAPSVKWNGGKADFVLTGDTIDKYTESLKVIAVLRSLQPQVEAAGGHMVVCLGNHEAEFLASGGDDKKGAEFEKELKTAGISPEDVAAGKDAGGIGAWLRNMPAGAKVGDWFMCHAGNTAGKTVADLESQLESALTQQGWSTPLLIDPNSMLEARMHPRPWFDGTGDPSLKPAKEPKAPKEKGSKKAEKAEKAEKAAKSSTDGPVPALLEATLTGLGVKHLVIGHQPGKATFPDGATRAEGQMFEHYHGAFFMIDTGMSRGVSSGRGAVLRVDVAHDAAEAIYADGKTMVLWK